MKIALVHDYLNQYGGAERVLECLMEMFPEAPIYTLLYDEQKTHGKFVGKKIITSFLDFKFVHNHHRWFIPLMPLAMMAMKIDDSYDLIISATAGYAKGISYNKKTKHFCYCYTPLRYAWEIDYLNSKITNYGLRIISKPILKYLLKWDFNMAQKPEKMVTLSNFIAQKIKNFYDREVEVLYPPLDTKKFFYDPEIKKENYYLAAGRLIHYKNFHIIIEAFNRLGLFLKIIGAGPELENLKKIAKSNIDFLGFVQNDNEMRIIYSAAKGFVFANVEDFGLVMAEAQACGAPVIALAGGGALEIVQSEKTGVFFNQATIEGLMNAVNKFEKLKFDRQVISGLMKKFSADKFKDNLQKHIEI
ncbi:MAG: glycosyltransferase [Patescibacteria group bacterium]